MSKSIRVRARIEGFSETHCLLYDVENLSDSSSFKRFHVWIPMKAVREYCVGTLIEFTGDIYYYGHNRKKGLHKIRKVVVCEQI